MAQSTGIRSERKFIRYSRGAELARAIHAMWGKNSITPYSLDRNEIIEERIHDLMAEFDLNIDERHHWARNVAKWEVS